MRGGAEDTDPAGGVFDDGEDVLTLPGQGDRLDEVDGAPAENLIRPGRSQWVGDIEFRRRSLKPASRAAGIAAA